MRRPRTTITLTLDDVSMIEDALSFYALGCDQEDYRPSEVRHLQERFTARRQRLDVVASGQIDARLPR